MKTGQLTNRLDDVTSKLVDSFMDDLKSKAISLEGLGETYLDIQNKLYSEFDLAMINLVAEVQVHHGIDITPTVRKHVRKARLNVHDVIIDGLSLLTDRVTGRKK
jgi:hypothetical protein